ncbi:hypothetical protein [Actinoplanes sp. G11-F43]
MWPFDPLDLIAALLSAVAAALSIAHRVRSKNRPDDDGDKKN